MMRNVNKPYKGGRVRDCLSYCLSVMPEALFYHLVTILSYFSFLWLLSKFVLCSHNILGNSLVLVQSRPFLKIFRFSFFHNSFQLHTSKGGRQQGSTVSAHCEVSPFLRECKIQSMISSDCLSVYYTLIVSVGLLFGLCIGFVCTVSWGSHPCLPINLDFGLHFYKVLKPSFLCLRLV